MKNKTKENATIIFLCSISLVIGFTIAFLLISKPETIAKCEDVEAQAKSLFVADTEKETSTTTEKSINAITNESKNGSFVASKNGTKYYPEGKGYSSRIKEENKVYFSSKAEAESAGYTPGSGVE